MLKKGSEPCLHSENDQMNLPDLVALDLRLVGFLLVASGKVVAVILHQNGQNPRAERR